MFAKPRFTGGILKPALFIALLTLCPVAAWADEFHYVNRPIGDRAAIMGGAFTAISDDPSGCYYNPAGIVRLSDESFSLSANLLQYESETQDDLFFGNDAVLASPQIVPTFWGVARPLFKGKVCFSIVLPDSTNLQTHQFFQGVDVGGLQGDLTIDLIRENQFYVIGPGYAHRLGRLSLGASFSLIYRKSLDTLRFLVVFKDDQSVFEVLQLVNGKGVGFLGTIGGMYDLSEQLSLGVVYRLPTTIKSRGQISSEEFNGLPEKISRKGGDLAVQTEEELAQSVTVGAAYRPAAGLLLSADLSYYAPVSFESGSGPVERKAVVNGSLGTEMRLSPAWRFLAGLFTDRTSAPSDAEGGHINLYGASTGFGYDTAHSSSSIGLIGSWGKGDYPDPLLEDSRKDLTRFSVAIALGGSVHF